MTTEDDFQSALDANPDDWQTRLVFADWLEDRGDPRAEGYRALGRLRKRPHRESTRPTNRPVWWWCTDGHAFVYSSLPGDWFRAIDGYGAHERFKPWLGDDTGSQVVNSRREAEDVAALVFTQLPTPRRTELLTGPASAA
jgi:uncharacterized protein (TIGR02996 family)